MDDKVTIEDLRQEAEKFVTDRNWSRYHTPKNLASSIAIEASELMEIFQWENNDEAKVIMSDENKMDKIKNETADILLYIFNLANELNFDIGDAVRKKIKLNEEKYPVEKVLKNEIKSKFDL